MRPARDRERRPSSAGGRLMRPRWLLVATLAAVAAGIMLAVWVFQAMGG